jgi:hypothetical protein
VQVGDQLAQGGVNGVVEAFPAAGCGLPSCSPTWTLDAGIGHMGAGPRSLFATQWNPSTMKDDLVAIDPVAHAISWKASLTRQALVGPAIANGFVYTTTHGDLLAFDQDGCGAATCPAAWNGRPSGIASAHPIVAGNVVYTGTQAGYVEAWNAAGCGRVRCTPLARFILDEPIGGLIVSGGRLYVGTASGTTVLSLGGA